MDGNGENPRKLFEVPHGDRFFQVQWSPAGDRIATLKSRLEGNHQAGVIETVPRMGGAATTILSVQGVRSFCWSSDGRVIYSKEEPPPNDKDTNLWELRVDSSTGKAIGSPRQITNWAGLSLSDLTISADGKHLVLVNAGNRSDLYVAALDGRGGMEAPRRLTLEGTNNIPSSWTPDGQTLFFYSDRYGNWNIFRQSLHEQNARDFVMGPGEQLEPRISPDGSWVFYWDSVEKGGQTSGAWRLMRIPISGGAPEPVVEASRGAMVRCAPGHLSCILSEFDKARGALIFSTIDPLQVKKSEVLKLQSDPTGSVWDLSPDGSSVAIVNLGENQDSIHVVQLRNGSSQLIPLGHSEQISGISWSVDGQGWFVTSSSVHKATIFHVSSSGKVSELWTTSSILGTPLASPDGKNLAFTISTFNSNAWAIENF
jgi:Tol biopolymer transport system component